MPLPSVEEVARYLRIEDLIEEEQQEKEDLQEFINAAVEELEDSGITNQESHSYGLAIKLLVANYYEQRRPQVVGTIATNLNFSLERIILRLKAAELGDKE